MAQAFLQSFDENLRVVSAGTDPVSEVNPMAVKVMAESGIDISSNRPENVTRYLDETWDYVITVCDNARETCPAFPGTVRKQLHLGFDDPALATGTREFIYGEFTRVRDEIKKEFRILYEENFRQKMKQVF